MSVSLDVNKYSEAKIKNCWPPVVDIQVFPLYSSCSLCEKDLLVYKSTGNTNIIRVGLSKIDFTLHTNPIVSC